MISDNYNGWCWSGCVEAMQGDATCRGTPGHVFPHIALAFLHLFHTTTSLWRLYLCSDLPRMIMAL